MNRVVAFDILSEASYRYEGLLYVALQSKKISEEEYLTKAKELDGILADIDMSDYQNMLKLAGQFDAKMVVLQ
ncbi:MAG: hypothetical protein QM571_06455 [Micrococcaceae bacterium]